MLKLIKCGFCNQSWTLPTALSCGHIFCADCLQWNANHCGTCDKSSETTVELSTLQPLIKFINDVYSEFQSHSIVGHLLDCSGVNWFLINKGSTWISEGDFKDRTMMNKYMASLKTASININKQADPKPEGSSSGW